MTSYFSHCDDSECAHVCCCVCIEDRGFFLFLFCCIEDFQEDKKSPNSGLSTLGQCSAVFSLCQPQFVAAASHAPLMVPRGGVRASVCTPESGQGLPAGLTLVLGEAALHDVPSSSAAQHSCSLAFQRKRNGRLRTDLKTGHMYKI